MLTACQQPERQAPLCRLRFCNSSGVGSGCWEGGQLWQCCSACQKLSVGVLQPRVSCVSTSQVGMLMALHSNVPS